ncbi:MAG: type II toxin-antitoxin system RelE/ParE family toxin [Bacteroidetes bacterium]|nr:type II toxin-antitoxin system RelE/ParE family toxin [Bacteroidota bacterium]
MAKQIVWAEQSKNDVQNIFAYWNQRNKSKAYSKRLNQLIEEAVNTISEHPTIGKLSGYGNVRFGILKPYLIVYEEFENEILIITIWDGRQDPRQLENLLK